MWSRLIIKNLPAYVDDTRRPDGKSRRFAFLGYKTNEEAIAAKKYFDRTYIGGSRISVEVVDSTKLQEPNKKRARVSKQEGRLSELDNASSYERAKAADIQAPIITKPSKAQDDFMEAFTNRNKGPSWLDSDAGTVVTSEVVSKQLALQTTSLEEQQPDNEDSETVDGASSAPISDLDWMRTRMKKNLDDDLPVEKAFYQDSSDGEAEAERITSANTADTSSESLRNTPSSKQREFSRFGTIEQVHIPLSSERTSKGLAYVSFTDIDSAQQALKAMDHALFQGRLLHVMPAVTRAGKEEADSRSLSMDKKAGLKKERATKRKENAGQDFNWGMLYMNSDAVLSSVADRLNISKADVLNPEASNASVRMALAETKVIEETKSFFEQQGVSFESFKSRAKSDTIILVKNIPYGTTADTLREIFSPFGDLSRILLPPSGTIGVVEFIHAVDASKAFKAVAYRRIKDSIIYLERGPAGMFKQLPNSGSPDPKHPSVASAVEPVSVSDAVADDSEIPPGATLFVKNLAFATTEEVLNTAFRSLPGFAFARIQTKPDPKRPGARLSMGFGFVGFRSVESAQRALSGMQGAIVDGHALQVKFAKRGEVDHQGSATASVGATKTTKVIVKNLPFEATKKDVRELFSAYGQLKSVRVPRKFNSQTRGFAFLDFISRREAENAFTALQHTHLLGRHLVLQWAEDGATDIEQLRQTIKTGWGDGTNIPGRKRKIDMLLDGTDGASGEVED
ncbi:Multiple RNA-binding domain-containing protein 1 [Rhizoctonia solani AG-1 IB]|uniref:Multiple RNA-binding domain-containing protein 1 n=1 Tax=Thanatephorus cucumeris (strain AG1-IB / isolate 7/3/14) TaxID=1108050 RepID=M5BYI5_THACB|nr:Multiple RNA-binding domain-containing protein 1 [Rhizoctonia solani AG-1 IB]